MWSTSKRAGSIYYTLADGRSWVIQYQQLHITHSKWASEETFSAGYGSTVSRYQAADASCLRRPRTLPYSRSARLPFTTYRARLHVEHQALARWKEKCDSSMTLSTTSSSSDCTRSRSSDAAHAWSSSRRPITSDSTFSPAARIVSSTASSCH